jgi:hypothetical protein
MVLQMQRLVTVEAAAAQVPQAVPVLGPVVVVLLEQGEWAKPLPLPVFLPTMQEAVPVDAGKLALWVPAGKAAAVPAATQTMP